MDGDRTDAGVTATAGALTGAVAVLLVVLGVVAVQRGLGSDDASPAPGAASAGDTTPPPSGPPSDPTAGPASSRAAADDAWLDEAVRAAEDRFPAFVPAELPAGWTVDSATYAETGRWRMELTTAAGGPVTVDQRDGADLGPGVAAALGDDARETGSVNLRRWGTGRWTLHEGNGRTALAQGLAGTAVVVSGDRGDVVRLTKQLLTAEMVVNVGDGSDG